MTDQILPIWNPTMLYLGRRQRAHLLEHRVRVVRAAAELRPATMLDEPRTTPAAAGQRFRLPAVTLPFAFGLAFGARGATVGLLALAAGFAARVGLLPLAGGGLA